MASQSPNPTARKPDSALIRVQAEQTASGKDTVGAFPAWNTSDIRAFVGVSGAYDLDGLAEHLHQRGLYKSMFGKIMSIDGEPNLTALSPLAAAQVQCHSANHSCMQRVSCGLRCDVAPTRVQKKLRC